MAINDPIHYIPATIALLIFASMLVLTHSAPPPPEKACSDEVIAFAPCLPYISNPPNNQTKSPSSQCCDLFSSAFDSGTANCLCYLLRDSHLLGFPLNRTRFISLSSICVPKDNSGSNGKQTLESLCSGSRNLPPLRGSPRRRHPPPPSPPPPRSKPPAKPGPQKPTNSTSNQTMQPKPPMAPTPKSCASKQIVSSIQLQPGIMMLIVSLSTKTGIVFRP